MYKITNEPDELLDVFCSSGGPNDRWPILLNPSAEHDINKANFSQGFPPVTRMREEDGGLPPEGPDFNGILYILSKYLFYLQSGGTFAWAAGKDYLPNFEVYGSDGVKYRCKQACGPNYGGAQDPVTTAGYWVNDAMYYLTEFKDFFEQVPPSGWAVRDGAVLPNADVDYPALWAYLQKSENAWKRKTLAEWEALSDAAEGVGGVPYFVLDTASKTIKLPDTRGDATISAGHAYGNALDIDGNEIAGTSYNGAVGNYRAGAVPNITAVAGNPRYSIAIINGEGAIGVNHKYVSSWFGQISETLGYEITFDASRVVPVASENRVRGFAMLGCVYVGGQS